MPSTLKEEPANWVGGIVDRSAEAERDAFSGEFVGDISSVGQGACKTVELGDHESVAAANCVERLA